MATRDRHTSLSTLPANPRRRGRSPAVTIHSATLVVPLSGPPIRYGAIAVRDGRVVALGPRKQLTAAFAGCVERHWKGMLVPGLVDAHTRIGRAPDPAAAARDLIRSGVVAVADVLDDHDAIGVLARSGLGGAAYLEVRCPDERTWEDSERDRLITAIRELDHTGVIGIAAHTPDLAVLEDLAILARTFGLRLHAEPSPRHRLAVLDETGLLGPYTHLVHTAAPLDPADRKLLRLRGTPVAVSPATASPEDLTALITEGNAVALHTGPGAPDLLAAARALLDALLPATPHTRARAATLARLAFETATMGGARALGLSDGLGRLGTLSPGSRADFAVYPVTLSRRDPYTALLHDGPGTCTTTAIAGQIHWPPSA
ncbi:cytosine/adenosine deaminase-related metal-dependent hydrolase [Thermocatellispora tengchongensis]|uniref:Cytosine/adenosine deaminase-related metal-dependent hydrolase n=1 Tax=Thermocatellispora tengchongensis TaxID=1073253 RepID=A0A840P7L9_9ACTN|nr:amidohydrolase family protein [Thermocatellispora tengchongensis]MBB5135302.1 cytosine/adenosine deaminase-related metal-dependent hydrolase [Thermocatellispora tengchongensis]